MKLINPILSFCGWALMKIGALKIGGISFGKSLKDKGSLI